MRIPSKLLIQITLLLLGMVLVWYLWFNLNKAHETIDILESDRTALLNDVKVITAENNDLLYTVQGLHVSNKELKEYNNDLARRLKEYDIEFKKTEGVITAQQKLIVTLNEKLKDRTQVRYENDTIILDTLKCFDFKDDYNTITGCIKEDTISATFSSEVPLDIVLENVYKYKFLWWRWKIINRKVTATSPNKSVHFTDIKLYIPN